MLPSSRVDFCVCGREDCSSQFLASYAPGSPPPWVWGQEMPEKGRKEQKLEMGLAVHRGWGRARLGRHFFLDFVGMPYGPHLTEEGTGSAGMAGGVHLVGFPNRWGN